MLTPGPDHPIAIDPSRKRVRAAFNGHVIADTDDALIVREADYPPVYYFPRGDVDMAFMGATDHHTTCPYKGEASYWSIMMDGDLVENVAWSYEEPYEAMQGLAGRIAFYPKVEVYEVDEADLTRAPAMGGDAGHSTI